MTTSTNKTDTRAQENFWYKLEQFKFDLYYYDQHFNRCISISRKIRIGTSLITSITSIVWMNFYKIPWVNTLCLVVVLILQVVNAAYELMPFDKRKLEIRELTNEITPLYNKMEHDWSYVFRGEWTVKKIEDKCFEYVNCKEEIQKHYFKDEILPIITSCKQKAKKQTDSYFENFK